MQIYRVKTSHYLELFDELVLPILNYGNEVWGFNQGLSIESLHLQYCQRLLKVKKSTQNDFIYGELGRLPLQKVKQYDIVKYWIKILHSEDTKYIELTGAHY